MVPAARTGILAMLKVKISRTTSKIEDVIRFMMEVSFYPFYQKPWAADPLPGVLNEPTSSSHLEIEAARFARPLCEGNRAAHQPGRYQ